MAVRIQKSRYEYNIPLYDFVNKVRFTIDIDIVNTISGTGPLA